MNPPLDQSVMDLLRQSAVGPMLDRPVNDVLKDMGFGPLPEIQAVGMPEMPPLPVIDLSLLAKPLTDLASTFGSGQLPGTAPAAAPAPDGQVPAAAPAQDPAQVMAQVSTAVQTAMQLGTSAMQIAMTLWQGMGAAEAAKKGTQAQKDGAAVSAQSAQTSTGVVTAASSVFTGATQMAGVIAKFMTSLVTAGPFIGTPPGQIFLVAMTTETLAEATVVVAKTRTELGIESADMMKTGQKVDVTDAPKGVDPMQMLSQLMQIVPTLASAATTGAQSIAQAHAAFNPPKPLTDAEKEKDGLESGAPIGAGGGMGGGGLGGAAAAARQLAPWAGARPAGGFGAAGASAPAATTSASAAPTASTRGSSMSPGMMPMGGAGAAAGMARAGETTTEGLRAQLVTEQHGNEVVGDIEGASLPVVGAAERVSEPLDSESPDKALTL